MLVTRNISIEIENFKGFIQRLIPSTWRDSKGIAMSSAIEIAKKNIAP